MPTVNDGLKINAPRHADKRYGKVVAGRTAPYANKAEVLASISLAYRFVGLTVNIDKEEWWWRNDISDENLVKKYTEGQIILFRVGPDDVGLTYKEIPELAGYLFHVRRDAMPLVHIEEYAIFPGGGFSLVDSEDTFVLNQRFELTITNNIIIV